jgi:hypothetical protein
MNITMEKTFVEISNQLTSMSENKRLLDRLPPTSPVILEVDKARLLEDLNKGEVLSPRDAYLYLKAIDGENYQGLEEPAYAENKVPVREALESLPSVYRALERVAATNKFGDPQLWSVMKDIPDGKGVQYSRAFQQFLNSRIAELMQATNFATQGGNDSKADQMFAHQESLIKTRNLIYEILNPQK